ncbi:Hemolysin, plasmid [Roseivivax sp. THAF40]|uniref:calcium-binding protein n=1 Tax=unclassified Roseivivax TaxID=2639302 RepID=UPI00126970BA|nr:MULTISPECIES: calcium-binding protein [unclassified Roseivivax]QFS82598.1 Hemolysin, plasmid [Roseivivax sp. THAF197b]QFT46367.1 Hemolysin, plasmid [Roseivivax sp. THAF40]
MVTAVGFQGVVNGVQTDLDTLGGYSSDIGSVLSGAETVLDLPGELEDELRDAADTIDLPNSIVTALGAVPFGIGTAIRQLDNVANSVSGTVDDQADVLAALDASWQPTRSIVDNAQSVNTTIGASISGLATANQDRVEQADLLVASLGDQQIFEGSELAARMAGYSQLAGNWNSLLDAGVQPVQAALSDLQTAIDAIENAVPSLSGVSNALDSALGVFSGAAGIANDIEDALDVTINLPFPLPDINVLDVLQTITEWIDTIVGIVEDFVIDVLADIGIDIRGVFDSIADEMLGFLDPFFDQFDVLGEAVAPLFQNLTSAISTLQTAFADLVADAEEIVGSPQLLDNVVVGLDTGDAPNPADTLTGDGASNAMFGLAGDDNLRGGVGDDFLFGGTDNDTMIGGAGNDEMFGGAGNDVVLGVAGDNLYDGGAGDDRLIAQDGDDTLIGGADRDLIVSGGGADSFVFMAGADTDIVVDFHNDIDTLLVDADLAGGLGAADFVQQNAITLNGFTALKVDDDVMILLGVTKDQLQNDIEFI